MIKDNQKYFNRLHVLLDALAVAGSYLLAWYMKFVAFEEEGVGALPMGFYFSALYFLIPGYIVLYYAHKLYTPKRSQTLEQEIIDVFKVNLIGLAGFMICLTAFKISNFSRGLLGIFFLLNLVITLGFRIILRKTLRYFRKKGYNLKYILLVGYSRAAEEYINRINANPQWGYVIKGILDNHVPTGTHYRGVKVLGRIGNLEVILPLTQLDEIAVTLSLADYDILEEIVSLCEKSGVHTKFIPDYHSLIPNRPYTEDLMGLLVINIRYVPLTNTLNRFIKRSMDILGSAAGLLVCSPLLLLLAILVKTTSKGPIIFKQERIGLHNKPFQMYKFRSMEVQTAEKEREGWTVKNDPRVTKIGRIMRKTSLDELPQLWNILKGDMSIVGPRPERPQFVERFKEEIPRYMIKHQVRPGLTGWAQVNGYRGDTSIRRRIECDLYYIENWSMIFDIKIMFMTLFNGVMNENAY